MKNIRRDRVQQIIAMHIARDEHRGKNILSIMLQYHTALRGNDVVQRKGASQPTKI